MNSVRSMMPNGDCYVQEDPNEYPWLFRPTTCPGDSECATNCVNKGYKLGGLCRHKRVNLFERYNVCYCKTC